MRGQSKYFYERLCNGEVQGELETTQPVSVQQVKTVYPETTGLRFIGVWTVRLLRSWDSE